MKPSVRLSAAWLVAVLVTLSLPLAALAAAPTQPRHVGHSIVVSVGANGADIVLVPDPSLRDKSAYDPNADAALLGAGGGMLSTYDSDGCGWPNCNPASLGNHYDKTITPPGGSSGGIHVSFSSSDPYGVPETWVTFNGNSHDSWTGSNPWNPTSMSLWDHWHVDAIMPSVGYPSGVGITGSGGDASWSRTITGNWQMTHYFSNITFHSIDIWNINETAGADFDFGNTTYSIQTDDSCLV